MAEPVALLPSAAFRDELGRRGGASAARCFQCGTCTSVCELAQDGVSFPRQQMLWSQWGLGDRLAADPGVWLCHQCNDCTQRCPRDARPGDVLQTVRSLVIERLAFPAVFGRLVGHARSTWPLLVGIPLLFWVTLLAVTGRLSTPASPLVWGDVVPHAMIYAVFFPVAGWVVVASWISGRRFWTLMATRSPRSGGFVRGLAPLLVDVATHRRFASCVAARPRQTGHLLLFWGFVGAAVTSGLLIVALYVYGSELPLPLGHPLKLLGNASAALLIFGSVFLVTNRLRDRDRAGASTAFDTFFLAVVVTVISTGVLAEIGRLTSPPDVALGIYVVHLGFVTTLFVTFPYSKFAHALYRTLALVHVNRLSPSAPGKA